MAGKYIDLSKAQKEELRRLTQLANRRIKAAFKAYEKEGLEVVPRDVVGDIQLKQDWQTDKYAISRSTKFTTQKEYREKLHMLRRFEFGRPGITEYTRVQREKTIAAMETSMGMPVPEALQEIINKMSAPQLSQFWNKFSNKSARIGMKYSSNDNMQTTITEFFSEDKSGLASGLAVNLSTGQLVKEKNKNIKIKK